MESRTQILGHPAHQIAVMFPIGAFGFSVLSDLRHTWSGKPEHAAASAIALEFALVSAAIAVPFGLIDYLAIEPGTRAKKVGFWHAVGNVAMLSLFGAARALRPNRTAPTSAKALSATAFLLSHVTAWAGTELINRHGVGVHDLIGQDAPSSLSKGQPRLEPSPEALEARL